MAHKKPTPKSRLFTLYGRRGLGLTHPAALGPKFNVDREQSVFSEMKPSVKYRGMCWASLHYLGFNTP